MWWNVFDMIFNLVINIRFGYINFFIFVDSIVLLGVNVFVLIFMMDVFWLFYYFFIKFMINERRVIFYLKLIVLIFGFFMIGMVFFLEKMGFLIL